MVNTALPSKRSNNQVSKYVDPHCPASDFSMADTYGTVDGAMTKSWSNEHAGAGWTSAIHRQHGMCERDEYPPA